ncbi:MAG: branched-chain amino acid ABC transporter permease [Aeromicrobium sp.]
MSRPRLTHLVLLVVLVLVLAAPLAVETSLLTIGLFAMAAIVGALGLTILTGAAGQLSLGHAFFLAVGAYGYAVLAGDPEGDVAGLGLPPVVAMVGAIVLSGLFGLAFSPVSSRLQGIYLGIASLGLVFLGQHVLLNAHSLTGGFNGRSVESFSVLGLAFDDSGDFSVLGVPFESSERRWYLFVILTIIAIVIARNVLGARPGRAFRLLRDSSIGADMMGIDTRQARRSAFLLASMYGGAAGVMTALAFERAVPQYYDFHLAVNFLVMITLGGLASIWGGVGGAIVVSALPLLLSKYAANLPLVADASGGGGGLAASVAASFIYGFLVIAVLLLRATGGLDRLTSATRSQSVH